METDSFFLQLFKQLPQTLFELIALPAERATSYRVDSVELKKSFRIDGVFLPRNARLPLYFVEVQFQRVAAFYANLFAKVFCYLEENNPEQDWFAVPIFPSRSAEPIKLAPYAVLLDSPHVKRIYLDELPTTADQPLGLGILQLVSVPMEDARELVPRLLSKARTLRSGERGGKVVQLVEELLLRKFTQFNREEIRSMFQLHDLRESKVWQEAHQEGIEEGIQKGIEKGIDEGKTIAKEEMVQKCVAKGMSVKQIAELMEIPVAEVRRLAKGHAR